MNLKKHRGVDRKLVVNTTDSVKAQKLADSVLTIRRGNSITAIVKALFEAADAKGVSRRYLQKVLKPVLDAEFDTERVTDAQSLKDKVAEVNDNYATRIKSSIEGANAKIEAPKSTDAAALTEVQDFIELRGFELVETVDGSDDKTMVFKMTGLSED